MFHAIIRNKLVESIVVWDGKSKWRKPNGTSLVALGDNPEGVGPGWRYEDKTFSAPMVEEAPPTPETFRVAIQSLVDEKARSRNYGDGVALASYASSTIPSWAEEASEFVAWRDAIWLYAYTQLARVEKGERPVPKVDEFLSELPVLWEAS